MWTASHLTESDLFLESLNLKCMTVTLMLISSISTHKAIISHCKHVLASWVGKVKLFHVINENVFPQIGYAGYISTLIVGFFGKIILSCCVGHNFFPSRAVFSVNCSIMIALNPKVEIPSSLHHFGISLLILMKLSKVGNITPNITHTYGNS
jgi:hypothetical protein